MYSSDGIHTVYEGQTVHSVQFRLYTVYSSDGTQCTKVRLYSLNAVYSSDGTQCTKARLYTVYSSNSTQCTKVRMYTVYSSDCTHVYFSVNDLLEITVKKIYFRIKKNGFPWIILVLFRIYLRLDPFHFSQFNS